jgi:ATP-dependent helicase/nuclease subunit A
MSENTSWTNAQSRAIDADNRSILISAAAGSGKTSVLIERYIKLLESGVPPERILVITFTRKAAVQLREKAMKALYKSKNPEAVALLPRVSQAPISTIHSFCATLIREFSVALKLDPSFAVLEESESKDMMTQAYDRVAYAYSNDDVKVVTYQTLLRLFSSGRGDDDFRELVFSLFEFLRRLPNPGDRKKEWLSMYEEVTTAANFYETGWGMLYLKMLKPEVEKLKKELDRFINDFRSDASIEAINLNGKAIELSVRLNTELEAILSMINHFPEIDSMASALSVLDGLARYPSIQSEFSEFRSLIDRWKKWIKGVKESFAHKWLTNTERQLKDMKRMYDNGELKLLLELTDAFGAAYLKLKNKIKALDFADLISEAYRLLAESKESNQLVFESLISRFSFIMMDEYQDTNPIQDSIVEMLSASPEVSVFRVGDIKQSIYRFQHAEPYLFKSRYDGSSGDLNAKLRRIDLPDNFRSAKPIVDFVNALFSRLMTVEFGGADYTKEHSLEYKYGTIHSEPEYSMEYPGVIVKLIVQNKDDVCLIGVTDRSAGDESNESQSTQEVDNDTNDETGNNEETALINEMIELERNEREAVLVARQILDLVNAEPPVFVFEERKGSYVKTPIAYRHITVLMSSLSSRIEIYSRIFMQMGVPLQAVGRDALSDIPFARDFINLLKIIDNPLQDIPLAGVLLSPICGLSPDLLYLLRHQANSETRLYEAISNSIEHGFESLNQHLGSCEFCMPLKEQLKVEFDLLNDFILKIEELRDYASSHSVSDLLMRVSVRLRMDSLAVFNKESSNAPSCISWIKAQAKDSSDIRLSKFIELIESKERFELPVGGTGDEVQITTIHQAKGLEFPVVLLADLSHQFNLQDIRKNILFDRELGFGCKVMHELTPTRYPSASFRVVERMIKTKQLEEELRKLYVALTRARERLIIIGTCTDSDIKNRHIYSMRGAAEQIFERENARSFSDWIIPVLLESQTFVESLGPGFIHSRYAGQDFEASFAAETFNVTSIDEMLRERTAELKQDISNDSNDVKMSESKAERRTSSVKISNLPSTLSYEYPYSTSTFVRSKVSASTLAHMDDPAGESVHLFKDFSYFKLPIFTSPITQTAFVTDEQPYTRIRNNRKSKSSEAIRRGLVTHAFMQNLPYGKGRKININTELERAVELGFISEHDSDLVQVAAIASMFDSELGTRLFGFGKAKTEWRFIARAEPCDIAKYPRVMSALGVSNYTDNGLTENDWRELENGDCYIKSMHPEDFILLQGVVDLIFEDEKGRTIIDWKTDSVSKDDTMVRGELYTLQMWAYNLAVTASFGNVNETLLGFVTTSKFMNVKFE